MIRLPPLLPTALGVAIVGLVAGLTHLVSILLLPDVATRDAYDLLAAHTPHNGAALGMALLPRRAPATR